MCPTDNPTQGGSDGRWKTPHQKAKQEHRLELGHEIELGDEGIWVTFARSMDKRAMAELKALCDEVRLPPHSRIESAKRQTKSR